MTDETFIADPFRAGATIEDRLSHFAHLALTAYGEREEPGCKERAELIRSLNLSPGDIFLLLNGMKEEPRGKRGRPAGKSVRSELARLKAEIAAVNSFIVNPRNAEELDVALSQSINNRGELNLTPQELAQLVHKNGPPADLASVRKRLRRHRGPDKKI
jgi:hypothetical protein